MWIDSAGKNLGANYNHIGNLAAGTVIDCFVKKHNFKIIAKNNHCNFTPIDKNQYFFFAIEGNCKVKLVYPYTKWSIFVRHILNLWSLEILRDINLAFSTVNR